MLIEFILLASPVVLWRSLVGQVETFVYGSCGGSVLTEFCCTWIVWLCGVASKEPNEGAEKEANKGVGEGMGENMSKEPNEKRGY